MSKYKIVGILLLAFAVLVLAGCRTGAVYNVNDAPITVQNPQTTLKDIETAIIKAGTGLGWVMTPEKPGLITARLSLREHLAVAEVRYDKDSYDIQYKDSENMQYSDGMIHKNYNGWILNLERRIRAELYDL